MRGNAPGTALPTRRLVDANETSIVQDARVPRSRFLGQWSRKMAFNAAQVVPFLVEEILPGDHMTYDVTAYIRMATPLFPMFDNQRIDTFFFFCPSRILWSNWPRFMGQQDSVGASIDYAVPYINFVAGDAQLAAGTLADHMGIPTNGQLTAANAIQVNALPFRAYALIHNTWFRDENVGGAMTFSSGDGPDAVTTSIIFNRAKAHDYFTSCLPWPQKFTSPVLPLSGTAPVIGLGWDDFTVHAGPVAGIAEANNATTTYQRAKVSNSGLAGPIYARMQDTGGFVNYPEIYADLSLATGVTINQLRQSWLIQELLERDARGGTRYVELIRSHFGVTNPDFRLQRPEYIGGGQSPLTLTPIAQTAPTAGVPLGALGAAGTATGQHRASYAATEHGYILGLINVRSELSYQQGLHRMWTRSTRYDFYWPSLAALGEQAVLRRELYCTGVDSEDNTVFGYQERWHEYRTRVSEVTGIFRSYYAGTLDAWHLAQRFTAAPTLNQTFVTDAPPMDRILAAGSAAASPPQQYLADILINRTAVRPMPVFGTPAAIGRF